MQSPCAYCSSPIAAPVQSRPARQSLVKLEVTLEIKLSCQLYSASIVGNAVVDAAEDGRSDHRGRIIKRRVIQNIARIQSQIESHAFTDSEFLRERRIPLEVVRREEEVATRVSDRTRSWGRKL